MIFGPLLGLFWLEQVLLVALFAWRWADEIDAWCTA